MIFSLIKRKFIIKNKDMLSGTADFNLPLIHCRPVLDENNILISKIRLIQRGGSAIIFRNSIHIRHLLRLYNILLKCHQWLQLILSLDRETIR